MNYRCLIYLKENPEDLKDTLSRYENPRCFLLKVSSNRLIDAMQIGSATDVSFNWKQSKKCSE